MRSRVIALMAVVSLLAGIVQFPIPAVATSTAEQVEHSHHHCCPKLVQTQPDFVLPALPSLPCGPNHSCCVVRAPAKLPSLPTGSNGKAERQPVHAIKVSLPVPDETSATPEAKSILSRSPHHRSTVLRI